MQDLIVGIVPELHDIMRFISNTNTIIPVSSQGANKIPSLVIASSAGAKQSHKKAEIAAIRSQ